MTRGSRLRGCLDAALVLACEVTLVVFFWKSAWFLGSVDFAHFGHWLGSTSPAHALGALVRLLGLAISGWLLVSTIVYAAGTLSGHRGVARRSGRVTLPLVRRVVDALAVATVAASTLGSTAGGAIASVSPKVAVVQPLRRTAALENSSASTVATALAKRAATARTAAAERKANRVVATSGDARGSVPAVGRHFPHPGRLPHIPPPKTPVTVPPGVVPSVENGFAGLPRGTKVVVVEPGDCLSVIAERYLGDWRLDTEIEALNYGRLQPDGLALVNDHWIYPGWVLVMPDNAVGTRVVGGRERTQSGGSAHGEQVAEESQHVGGQTGADHEKTASEPGRSGERTPPNGQTRADAAKKPTNQQARVSQPRHEKESHGGEILGARSPVSREVRVPVGQTPAPAPARAGEAQTTAVRGDSSSHEGREPQTPHAPSATDVRPAQPANGTGAGRHSHERQERHEQKSKEAGVSELAHAAGDQQPTRVRPADVAVPGQHEKLPAGRRGVVRNHHGAEIMELAGFGAVAAAGVVWRIQRWRREIAHGRPKGRVPARNRAQVQAAERRARAVASEEAMRWVDLGLRYLGALVEQSIRDALVSGAFEETWPVPGGRFEAVSHTVTGDGRDGNGGCSTRPAGEDDNASATGEVDQNGSELAAVDEDVAWRRWWDGEVSPAGSVSPEASDPKPAAERVDVSQVPSLVMARVGICGLEVVLSPRPSGRLGWFSPPREVREVPEVREGPEVPEVREGLEEIAHVLDTDIGLDDLEALAAERWPAWPALVALGETDGSTVLLNLEHSGVLSVEGRPERVRGVLAGFALQLSSQPWADEMLGGLYTVGESPLDGRLEGRVQHVEPVKAMDLAEKLDGIATARQELAGQGSLSVIRALACEALPNVAVAFEGTPAPALRCLAEAAVPERSGVALVAAGPVEGARWRLLLSGPTGAVLEGPGERREFSVELVSAVYAEEVALLSEAVDGPRGEGLVDVGTIESASVQSTNGNGSAAHSAASVERGAVEIRLLGPVDVVGGDMGALDSSRIMATLGLLAYLASHPRPVTAEELATSLWPLDASKDNLGGPQRKTVMNVVSRARAVLGYGNNGKERLVLTPQGYRLTSDVTSDWARFERHVLIARGLRGEGAIAHLREALELVRGEPLGGAMASQFFEWVASEHLDMTISAKAVDVAQDLGELALQAGDLETVYWAVDKGLQLEPTREELFRLWMHALGASGRPARVDDVYRRLKLVLRQRIHPLQEPQPESREVWRRYTSAENVAGRPGDW